MSTPKTTATNATAGSTVKLTPFQELEQLAVEQIQSAYTILCAVLGTLFEQRVKNGGMPESEFWASDDTYRDMFKLATYRDSGRRDVFGAPVMVKDKMVSTVANSAKPLIVDLRIVNAKTFAGLLARFNGSKVDFFRSAYDYCAPTFKLVRDLIATGLAQDSDKKKLAKIVVEKFASSDTHITDAKIAILEAVSGQSVNVAFLHATESAIKTWLKTDREAKDNGTARPASLKWTN